MDFVNRTDVNARFLSTVMGEDRMLGAVIARPTFRIEGSRLVHAPEDPWPIEMAPNKTPYGEFPGEVPFLNGGVDVFVLGRAYPPGGRPATQVTVDIRVGSRFRRAIRVTGDRRWERRGKALVPGDPQPFASMPLTYENAFGGRVSLEEGELPYPPNPAGKGVYVTPEAAEGSPLPNLEDPENPIGSFADRPVPVGTAPYPADGSLRAVNAARMSPDRRRLERLTPLMFNAAHPRMIVPAAEAAAPGERVEVTHVRPEGDLSFTLPERSLHAHVQLEGRSYLCPLHLDQIGILAEESKVFLSYRVSFKYRVVPYEHRQTTLHDGEPPASTPADYVTTWED